MLLFVDDFFFTHVHDANEMKKIIGNEFNMKDLGAARKILGMDI